MSFILKPVPELGNENIFSGGPTKSWIEKIK